MKLSIWVIVDWLSKYNPILEINSGNMSIESVRLFSEETKLEKNTLYIGTVKEFFGNEDARILCSCDKDIVILKTDKKDQVLNEVLNAFDFYMKWYNGIVDMINEGCLLSTIVDMSSNVFNKPIFILDSSQLVMALSEKYGIGEVDYMWDSMLIKGGIELEKIVEFNKVYASTRHSKELYSIEAGLFPNKIYCFNLFHSNDWSGVICIIEHLTEVGKGSLDLLSILKQLVEKWLEIQYSQNRIRLNDELLVKLVEGSTEIIPEFERIMELKGWSKGDRKIIFKMESISDKVSSNYFISKSILNKISGSYSIVYKKSIVMIVNMNLQNEKEIFENLRYLLNKSNYFCGYSLSFSEWEQFSQSYIQASIALDKAEKRAGKIVCIKENLLEYGLEVMKSKIEIDITHPGLNKALEYDEVHKTELTKTLYCYLRNDRSQILTSKELNLHRSTLLYRLKRLNDLIEVDMNDYRERLHILISIEIMKIE